MLSAKSQKCRVNDVLVSPVNLNLTFFLLFWAEIFVIGPAILFKHAIGKVMVDGYLN